jgi:hypothetical protein
MLRRVLSLLLSALITCAASLALGQAVLRLCGWTSWSWLSAPVGLSVLMLLASPALHVPGRAVTCGIVILLAVVAAIVLLARDRAAAPRVPLLGLLYGLWPFALALVPFIVAGRSGTLGVSVSNDMSSHLLWAQGIMDQRVIDANGIQPGYPLGPHGVVAAIAAVTGMPVDEAFAGFTVALPVLLGWTALAALDERDGWWRQLLVVALCGMPFMVAAYFGQAAFKEIQLALLILGFALLLDARQRAAPGTVLATDRRRWIPAAIVVAGMVSAYSYAAGPWPLLLVVLWLVGLAVAGLVGRGAGFPRRAREAVLAELPALAIGVGVLIVVLLPQAGRIHRYLSGGSASSPISKEQVGNLVSRVSPWEAFGMWDNPDFRFGPIDGLSVGVWTGLVLALCLVGAIGWIRRGRWMVPAAAVAAALVWAYVDGSQSIYVSAKGVAIMAPLVMLTAAGAFLERPPRVSARGVAIVAPLVAIVLVYKVADASFDALRRAPVGPRDHIEELQALRPKIHGPTAFLGADDFATWALAGKHVAGPTISSAGLPTRPQKNWALGQALDFDTVAPDIVNTFDYYLTPKDAAGSALPAELKLVAQTKDYALYRRTGTIAPRQVLAEGEGAAAVLDCKGSPEARRLSRQGGTAAIEDGGLAVAAPALFAGADRTVDFKLPRAGTWDFVMAYSSALPIIVSAPGMATRTLAPNLDWHGPRFPVGTIRVDGPQTVPVRLRVDGHPGSSTAAPAIPTAFIAVPRGTERTVPLRKACGQAVDYYRPGG